MAKNTEVTFTLEAQIYDKKELADAAARRSVADGNHKSMAAYFREYPRSDYQSHLVMLLDPGALPGCRIHQSSASNADF